MAFEARMRCELADKKLTTQLLRSGTLCEHFLKYVLNIVELC